MYRSSRTRVNWTLLLPLLILSGILSLSAHVLILYSGIPFPGDYPHLGWVPFADLAVQLFAMTLLYRLAYPSFEGKRWFARSTLLFLLVATVQERLLRAPLIDTFATTAFRYSVLTDSKALIAVFLASTAIAFLDKHLTSRWVQAALSLSLAGVLVFLVAPLVNAGYAHLLARFDYLSHPGLYTFPYPWQLNVPAYITFIEPTVSAAIIYSLVRRRLAKQVIPNLLEFALLMAAIRYALLGPLLYPLVTHKLTRTLAVASKGQFLLEALTLGVTVGASCRIAVRDAASPTEHAHSALG